MRWILSALKEEEERLKRGREKTYCWLKPECESIIDEGDDWPDDKEGKGDWKNTWVEAVQDGVPQH